MTKKKARKIKERAKKAVECPYCKRKVKLKRTGTGIFKCPKCNSKFTGKAYHVEEEK